MASISPVWLLPAPKPLTAYRIPKSHFPPFKPIPPIPYRARRHLLPKSATSPVAEREEEDEKGDEESVGIDALHRFIHLNLGTWNGLLTQYDSHGRLLQSVTTKLAVGSYGEDELISLIQTLYIKQPPSRTSISGHNPEPEWAEYKIKETNMFTVDKYQQIGLFPNEKAFSLRYQTAGMLETVLREGVLGEDDTGEESPRNLKLPSRRPSVVCENCLFSQEKDMRARAFHIMDPRGILEMLFIFLEQKGDGVPLTYQVDISKSATNRLSPLLGQWKGHSITKRSGVYGATVAEAKTVALLDIDDKGQLIQVRAPPDHHPMDHKLEHCQCILHGLSFQQLAGHDSHFLRSISTDITSTPTGGSTTNVHWTGTVSDNLIIFDGGFQMTLLPGGMYMGCPCDVGKSVAQSQSFHLEFCWMESLDKRQRLVRTYDVEGLAVSSTYFTEVRVQRSL